MYYTQMMMLVIQFKAGVEAELAVLGIDAANIEYISSISRTQWQLLQMHHSVDVDVLILYNEPTTFAVALDEMANQSFEVPVLASYVNADPTYVHPAQYPEDRPIFTNAWVDGSLKKVKPLLLITLQQSWLQHSR